MTLLIQLVSSRWQNNTFFSSTVIVAVQFFRLPHMLCLIVIHEYVSHEIDFASAFVVFLIERHNHHNK